MKAHYVALATASLLTSFVTFSASAAQGTVDPGLSLSIQRADPNVVLSWPGVNGVQYQVESSANFNAWSNASPVLTGTNGLLFHTNSTSLPGRSLYRVKRLLAGSQSSAVFNPMTGILTIIGDDLDNVIIVGRDVVGTILVNNGAIPITGGMATIANTLHIQVFGQDGNDQVTIDQSGGIMPAAHLFGEAGSDTLTGGSGADHLAGGPGIDTLIGRGGIDRLYGEDDDDTFIWNPGDSSDAIEGGGGVDTLTFNGSGASEGIGISANGSRLRFTRDVASIVMDVGGLERVNFQAFGGADNIVVNSLAGTAVNEVNIDVAAAGGGGDAQIDLVTINGTAGADTFSIAGNAGAVEVYGLGALVRMRGAEVITDAIVINGVGGDLVYVNGSAGADLMTVTANGTNARVDVSGFTAAVQVSGALTLAINGLDGPDTISCVGNLAALVPLRLDGGPGNDAINGSNGADLLLGGDGNDHVDGNQGNDLAFLGADDDTFQWDPGDGNDTVEGQGGLDTLVFNGSGAGEIVEASANGNRLRFTRNIGNILMDLDGVERVSCQALGGADSIIVNSLVGTAVVDVNINLAAVGGATGDAQVDVVAINGTAAPDIVNLAANADAFDISGLSAHVRIMRAEATNDVLVVNTVGGADLVTMTGSDAADAIAITANGAFARVTATGFPVTMDLGGAETLAVDVLGGADNVALGSLEGTALTRVNLNLAAVGGIASDAEPDVVSVTGTPLADIINLAAYGGAIDLSGLPALVQISHSQATNDLLVINGAGGGDRLNINASETADTIAIVANGAFVRVDSTALPADVDLISVPNLTVNALGGPDTISCVGNLAALIALQLDGGPGNDTINGSNGADLLLGGDGNDHIDGNQGNDFAFLGGDDDTFNWDPGDGNDTVEGQGGLDTLAFNGSGAAENIGIAANGSRLRFTRDVANIVMDLDGVERVNHRALGGADNVIVNSLAGTGVTEVNIDVAAAGGAGDAQIDLVTLNGTTAADTFNIAASAGAVEVSGLGVLVRMTGAEVATDAIVINGVGGDLVNVNGAAAADLMVVAANGTNARVDVTGFTAGVQVSGALTLAINGLDGSDTISCVGNLAALVPLRLDGGPGNDTINGSNGADVLLGGDGNDHVDGNQGNDFAFLGDDDDTFQWDPGDGNDTVEGQGGLDTMVFNGSGAGEIVEASANGNRLRFTRNIGNILMDLDGVERVNFQALGAADNIIVNSLAGTAVTEVNIDLAAVGGTTGDAQADVVTVNGTAAADAINLAANAGTVEVSGLSVLVRIMHSEVANDSLVVNGLAGTDTITIGSGVTSLIAVTVNQ